MHEGGHPAKTFGILLKAVGIFFICPNSDILNKVHKF